MAISCIIIAGALWMSDGTNMVQPVEVKKSPDYEIVNVVTHHGGYNFRVGEQHQISMGTDEFMDECVRIAMFDQKYLQIEIDEHANKISGIVNPPNKFDQREDETWEEYTYRLDMLRKGIDLDTVDDEERTGIND